jgi:transcriptional regulator with GAF, ATPase, and Fis domain
MVGDTQTMHFALSPLTDTAARNMPPTGSILKGDRGKVLTGPAACDFAVLATVGDGLWRERDQVVQALSEAGFKAVDQPSNAPGRAGALVLFDRLADDVCAEVTRLSNAGKRRVVAVTVQEDGLAGSSSWDLLGAGAADALTWHGATTARELAARFERWREVDEIIESPIVRRNLVGEDLSWRLLLRGVVEVACFSAASVLITGESGTGKELIARLIHALDRRPDKGQLVVVDCTTVVPTLSGSEFFGHERGAFTGAVTEREGAFALANGGTLFLDEVGELPLSLQAELLRIVQEGSYKRVGSNRWLRASFRLVCATNRDLAAEQASGRFRRDFYYRIAGWACRLPSLHERRSDVPALTQHFLDELSGPKRTSLDQPLRDYLQAREYPGNVRDLRQLVARLHHHHVGDGPITAGALPPEECPAAAEAAGSRLPEASAAGDGAFADTIRHAVTRGIGLKDLIANTREAAICAALEAEGGNVRAASRRLGVTDRAIHLHRAAQRNGGTTGD